MESRPAILLTEYSTTWSASLVTETSSEMQNHSCTECSKTTKISRRLKLHVSSNHNKKDLHAFDYEVILLKSKLRELKHLRKKKSNNQASTRFVLFYAKNNPHAINRTRNSTFRSQLATHLSRKYGRWLFSHYSSIHY